MRVYVLIGFPKDTFAAAEQRLKQMVAIGFTPYAMLWRPETPSQMKWAPEESWPAISTALGSAGNHPRARSDPVSSFAGRTGAREGGPSRATG
jgi:hypothetical protein